MNNSKQYILLVNGDESTNNRLKQNLRPDFEVIQIIGGEQTYIALQKYDLNVVAMILNMTKPFNKCFSIFKTFKMHQRWKNIPIIITSNFDDTIIDKISFQLGAWDYLKLPEGMDTLAYRVEAAAERSQYKAMSELNYLNNYDMLTGIYNKKNFFEKTQKMIKLHEETFAFVRIDINRFKLYNSFFGKNEGDKLIKFMANRLISYIQKHDICTAGRIEADVFGFCMPNNSEVIQESFIQIKKALNSYNENYDIAPAFGIYVIHDKELSMDRIYSNATLAAKKSKGNVLLNFTYYSDEFEDEIIREQNIANDMNMALEQNQFLIYLQPKYNLKLEKIEGAEALVRWNHPEKGMQSPMDFIPVFERNGFIIKLDFFVWEEVCKLLRKWLDEGKKVFPISVNISRVNIYNPQFVSLLTGLVEKYELSPNLLELEITETTYMDNPDAMVEAINRLQDYGFKILMDDFGSGYSSLNVLKDLEIDVIKIDMKFFELSKNESRAESIIIAIIRMAKWLELPIVAEGVETREQVDFLKSLGCEYVQGYYFSKPVPVEEYLFLVEHEKEYLDWVKVEGEQQTLTSNKFAQNLVSESSIANLFDGTTLFEWNTLTGEIEVLKADEGFFNLTGLTVDTMNQKSYDLSFLESSGLKQLNEMMEKTMISGVMEKGYFYNELKDGTILFLEARLKIVGTSEQDHLFYLALIDLTSYNNREKKLKLEISKLEELLEKQKLELGENEGDRDRTGICLL